MTIGDEIDHATAELVARVATDHGDDIAEIVAAFLAHPGDHPYEARGPLRSKGHPVGRTWPKQGHVA